MTMHLLDVTPTQIMGLWEDLMSCLSGTNGYGSYEAEIYLYRFMERDPYAETHPDTEQAREGYVKANRILYELCRIFEERQEVKLWMSIGGERHPIDLLVADPSKPWTHRVHIGIDPQDARGQRVMRDNPEPAPA